MPSTSEKQAKFMRAIAHGWEPTRMKSPPSRKVAKKFMAADQRLKKKKAKRYQLGGLAQMARNPRLRQQMMQRGRGAARGSDVARPTPGQLQGFKRARGFAAPRGRAPGGGRQPFGGRPPQAGGLGQYLQRPGVQQTSPQRGGALQRAAQTRGARRMPSRYGFRSFR